MKLKNGKARRRQTQPLKGVSGSPSVDDWKSMQPSTPHHATFSPQPTHTTEIVLFSGIVWRNQKLSNSPATKLIKIPVQAKPARQAAASPQPPP